MKKSTWIPDTLQGKIRRILGSEEEKGSRIRNAGESEQCSFWLAGCFGRQAVEEIVNSVLGIFILRSPRSNQVGNTY